MVLARYIGGCGAGRCYCSIQPNGVICPCVYLPSKEVGNVRQQRFAEIWRNALFDTLSDREDRGDHCGVCTYRNYCGGCRARSVSYTGDIQAGDPGCIYNAHEWVELTTHADHQPPLGAPDHVASLREGIPRAAEPLLQILSSGVTQAAVRSSEIIGVSQDEAQDWEGVKEPWSSTFHRN